MITRIVKLSFKQSYCFEFEQNFPQFKSIVQNQKGCQEVSLKKDLSSNTYFTISLWEREEDLNKYRNSLGFKNIWTELKAHFSEKAEAWTTLNL